MIHRESAPPDRAVALWLLGVCALVYVMILVGGATRLTDSGLSITEWDLAKGLLPPMSDAAWAQEFSLYQKTTEFQTINQAMTMGEFQYIYAWEWGHRFLGKVIGVVFAIPFFFFWATGRLRGRFLACLSLFALGGLQGAIGWWMVTSGLYGRLDVSSFRLMTHLGMAFLIIGLAAYVAMGALGRPKVPSRPGAPRALLAVCGVVVFCQILMGALVAGIDAGRTLTDWPTMGGEWFPSGYFDLSPFSANLFENHATAQFNHRIGGYVTALLGLWVGVLAWTRGAGPARAAGLHVGAIALAQTVLGVATVMHAAPLSLSLIHQGLAVLLWLCVIAAWRASAQREPATVSEGVGRQGVAGAA